MKKILSAILALAMVVSVVSVCGGRANAAKALPEGVLYYWGFENDADLTAVQQVKSQNSAAYEIVPSNHKVAIAEKQGVVGNALMLDGTYGVKLNDLEALEKDEYTISFWAWANPVTSNAPIVQMGSNMASDEKLGTTTWMNYVLVEKDGVPGEYIPAVWMSNSSMGTVEFPGAYSVLTLEDETSYPMGEWVMITVAVDGNEFKADDYETHVGTKLYLNGKLAVDASAETKSMAAALPNLLTGDAVEGLIGINYDSACFTGYVDELYIFGKALDEEAVLKLYESGNPSKVTAPTAAPATPAAPTAPTAPGKVPAPEITKNPTTESVTEGGNAYFVAYGKNYNTINWYIVSADHGTRMTVASATRNFPGLTYSGDGTTTLLLSNIPLTLNGWCVEATFTGEGGTATTNHCYVNVSKPAKAPLYAVPSSGIYTDPKPVQLTAAPGDTIAYELIDEYGVARTGTVKSGDYVTIPLVYDIIYVARLTAYVVGDQSNLTVCEYTMDGTTYSVPETTPVTEPITEPATQPSFDGGGYTNNEATVTLTPTGSGNFYANVSILRLCNMDGVGSYSNGIVTMFLTDPAGNPMGASFNVSGATLTITSSTWELLPTGTAFYGVY